MVLLSRSLLKVSTELVKVWIFFSGMVLLAIELDQLDAKHFLLLATVAASKCLKNHPDVIIQQVRVMVMLPFG